MNTWINRVNGAVLQRSGADSPGPEWRSATHAEAQDHLTAHREVGELEAQRHAASAAASRANALAGRRQAYTEAVALGFSDVAARAISGYREG